MFDSPGSKINNVAAYPEKAEATFFVIGPFDRGVDEEQELEISLAARLLPVRRGGFGS